MRQIPAIFIPVFTVITQRYAIVDDGVDEGSLGLLVSGVESFADHMASRRLLESLASVEAVLPERVQDDQVQYRVLLRGDRAALEDELRLRSEVELQESSELDNVLLRWRAK